MATNDIKFNVKNGLAVGASGFQVINTNAEWVGSEQSPYGATGYQGPDGDVGTSGLDGATGVIGNDGATGIQGIPGIAGDAGNNGYDGATGAQGVRGDQGPDGPLGLDGDQGVSGASGSDGTQGSQGEEGVQGATGASISAITIAIGYEWTSGQLLWNGNAFAGGVSPSVARLEFLQTDPVYSYLNALSPGTQIVINWPSSGLVNVATVTTIGTVQGPTAYTGGRHYLQISANPDGYASGGYASTDTTPGDILILGSGLVNAGPRGTRGATGQVGATGQHGARYHTTSTTTLNLTTGATGVVVIDDYLNYSSGQTILLADGGGKHIHATVTSYNAGTKVLAFTPLDHVGVGSSSSWEINLDGAEGPAGATGVTGQDGTQGLLGDQGTQGLEGQQGTTGDTGQQGVDGNQGTQGSLGPTGEQGDQGELGDQGVTGATGNIGIEGDTGPQGDQGLIGEDGYQGASGATGYTGSTGAQGTDGSSAGGTYSTYGPSGSQTIIYGVNAPANSTTFAFNGTNSPATGDPDNGYAYSDNDSADFTQVAFEENTASQYWQNIWLSYIQNTSARVNDVISSWGPYISAGHWVSMIDTLVGVSTAPALTGYIAAQEDTANAAYVGQLSVGAYGVAVLFSGVEYPGTSISSISDTGGLTWIKRTGITAPGYNGTTQTQEIWYAINNTGSSVTSEPTIYFNDSFDDQATILTAWSGVNLSYPWAGENPTNIGFTGLTGATGVQGPVGNQGYNADQLTTGIPRGPWNNYTEYFVDDIVQCMDGLSHRCLVQNTNFEPNANPAYWQDTAWAGASGASGIDGASGPTGETGTDGASGVTGETGQQGQDGVDGVIGTQGATGVDGASGVTGITGATGYDGASGVTGEVGIDGATGSHGIQFKATAQGNFSISAVGTSQLAVPFQADPETGNTFYSYSVGQSIIMAYDINNYMVGDITATDGTYIDFTVTKSVGNATSVSGWIINLDGAFGIQGATGVTGQSGAQGPIGDLGTQGASGADGEQGPDGATGIRGASGVTGITGGQGDEGPQGVDGVQGDQGATGIIGDQGTQGDTGSQGYTGSKGYGLTSGATGLSTTAQATVDIFAANEVGTAKYLVQAVDGSTNVQATEVILTQNASGVYMTEYATLRTGATGYTVMGVTATSNGSVVSLKITPTVSNTNISWVRESIQGRIGGITVNDVDGTHLFYSRTTADNGAIPAGKAYVYPSSYWTSIINFTSLISTSVTFDDAGVGPQSPAIGTIDSWDGGTLVVTITSGNFTSRNYLDKITYGY